jgi:polysaccharide export outer membrane protein
MAAKVASRIIRVCLAAGAAMLAGCAAIGPDRGEVGNPYSLPFNPDPAPALAPVPNFQSSREGDGARGPRDRAIALAGYDAEAETIVLPAPGEASWADEASDYASGVIELPLPSGGGYPTDPSELDVRRPGGIAPLPPPHSALSWREKFQQKSAVRDAGIRTFNGKFKNPRPDMAVNNPQFPRELRMRSHPLYVVEPPDVLFIEALQILPNRPLLGERLIRQDGTISLGYYGQIHVAGLTLLEVENKLREHLKNYVEDPQVYVDVASFNSKVYYILGQVNQQGRLPITGKETVLDAIMLAGGITNFADRSKMHVARPNPGGGCDQILWVDWKAIAFAGDTRTNYQLMPGDRVVVPATKGFGTSVLFDNYLSPIERLSALFSLFRFALSNNN